jgi:hypothetical protein
MENRPSNYPLFVCAEFIPPNKIAYYKYSEIRWDGIVHDVTHFFQYQNNPKEFLNAKEIVKRAAFENFGIYKETSYEREAFKVQEEYLKQSLSWDKFNIAFKNSKFGDIWYYPTLNCYILINSLEFKDSKSGIYPDRKSLWITGLSDNNLDELERRYNLIGAQKTAHIPEYDADTMQYIGRMENIFGKTHKLSSKLYDSTTYDLESTLTPRSEVTNSIRIDKTKNTKSYADIANVDKDTVVTIYRCVPKGYDTIDPGDFVTPTKYLAMHYGKDLIKRNICDEAILLTKKVRADDIRVHPDHLAHGAESIYGEFIYNPQEVVNKLSWLAYNMFDHIPSDREKIDLAKTTDNIDYLTALSRDEDSIVRSIVLYNENVTTDILEQLSKDNYSAVRVGVARNKNTPKDILDYLSKDVYPVVRKFVAENNNTSSETLAFLSKDSNGDVKEMVAENDSTPINILEELCVNTPYFISSSAKETLFRVQNYLPKLAWQSIQKSMLNSKEGDIWKRTTFYSLGKPDEKYFLIHNVSDYTKENGTGSNEKLYIEGYWGSNKDEIIDNWISKKPIEKFLVHTKEFDIDTQFSYEGNIYNIYKYKQILNSKLSWQEPPEDLTGWLVELTHEPLWSYDEDIWYGVILSSRMFNNKRKFKALWSLNKDRAVSMYKEYKNGKYIVRDSIIMEIGEDNTNFPAIIELVQDKEEDLKILYKVETTKTASEDFDFYKDQNKKMYQKRLNYYNEDEGANIFWSSKSAQEKRFEALLDIGDLTNKEILDIGCGYCDLLEYIKNRGINIKKYTGVDIVPEIVDKAKNMHPDTNIEVRDIQKEPIEENSFDYVFGSGIFALEDKNWSNYTINMLKTMLSTSRIGVGVNFLTGNISGDGLMRLDPNLTLEFVKKYVNKTATLKNNYLQDDFSIFIYK